jgi:leucyl/phenylalanyl-tRNA--protein transferase
MTQLHWLAEDNNEFPPTKNALDDPNGLLAVGGDLSPERLIAAYSRGIFPWFSEGQPLLWWTPSPRMVLLPENVHFGRTLRKLLRKRQFTITVDTAFESVMRQCGTIDRRDQDGSWITEEMVDAYLELHSRGIAHSVEAWQDGELVGGLYGVALGRAYFGESMFSLASGASKAAFSALVVQLLRWGVKLIDCQIETPYLASFGATEIPRDEFELRLNESLKTPPASIGDLLDNDHRGLNDRFGLQSSWSTNWEMPEYGFDEHLFAEALRNTGASL